MKKTILFAAAGVLVSTALVGRENLLDGAFWQRNIERPAVGTLESAILPMQADSVLHAAVRYGAQSAKPLAAFTRTFHNMVPKRYLFGAWVQITRPQAALALEARDADGNVISTISVNTKTDAPGALVPGRWTPVEMEADLSAYDAAALRTVTFAIAPQWADGSAVIGETLPDIYVNDAYLYGINAATGSYDVIELPNGGFGAWDGADVRTPRGWSGWPENATRCAGAHIIDNGAALKAGQTLTLDASPIKAVPYILSFKARADRETKVTVEGQSFTVKPGGWQSFSYKQTYPLDVVFQGNDNWQLDEVRIRPYYDAGHPRPAERTLVVTTSADDGPGSLREAVAMSATGDLIAFDVDEVNLLSPIDLSDRSITIDGNPRTDVNKYKTLIKVADDERAFYVNPTVDGTVLTLKNLQITGVETALPGSALYVGDSRATGSVSVVISNVFFDYCKSTVQGGAIYVNAPGATVVTKDRTAFRCCEAPSGSAVCFAGGEAMTLTNTSFEGCIASASPGGAVLNLHKTAPLAIDFCRFTYSKSSAANSCAGVAVQYASSLTTVTRTDFDAVEGGSVRVYNSTRSSGGETILANNTFIYNSGSTPAVTVGGGASYTAPAVTFVNNLMAYNSVDDLEVTRGSVTGTHNLAKTIKGVTLDNPVADNGKPIFNLHIDTGALPYRNLANNGSFLINREGPAYGTGTKNHTSALGKECVVVYPYTYYDENVVNVGSSQESEYIAGVDDVTADANGNAALRVWPNPATDYVHVEGDFSRVFITNMAGTTVYVGNARTIDVSGLQRGIYILSAENKGKIATSKLIVK